MAEATSIQHLLMWGIHPFMPRLGIFNGGFQSPLYPAPSNLFLEILGPQNPSPLDANFLNRQSTEYTLDNYVGLGTGDPGLDYINPGHILSVMDTFFRMAYGLGVIKAARDSLSESNLVTNVDINRREAPQYQKTIFNTSNLYPRFGEVPTDYLNTFLQKLEQISQNATLSQLGSGNNMPLLLENNIVSQDLIHIPIASELDFENLFGNILIDTYFLLTKQLRDLMDTFVSEIDNFTTLKTVSLDNIPFLNANTSQIKIYPQIDAGLSTFTFDTNTKGEYINLCRALSKSKALELINNDGLFHDGGLIDDDNIRLEYRTMHELQGVINLMPIQINGGRYSLSETSSFSGKDINNPHWMNYFICDVNLNIINHGAPKTININGNASFVFNGTLPLMSVDNPFPILGSEDDFGRYDILTNAGRSLVYEFRSTNKFGWDKIWFGLEDHEQVIVGDIQASSQLVEDTIDFPIGGGEIETRLITTNPTNETFSFSEDLTLVTGQNNIILRIMVESHWSDDIRHFLAINTTETQIDDVSLTINVGDILSESFTIPGAIQQAISP